MEILNLQQRSWSRREAVSYTHLEKDSKKSDTKDSDAESKLKDALDDSIKFSEKEIGKEETVYVLADSTGKERKVIVSDHLINDGNKDTIEDASDLKDIENVKGDETFKQDGSKLTWQAAVSYTHLSTGRGFTGAK